MFEKSRGDISSNKHLPAAQKALLIPASQGYFADRSVSCDPMDIPPKSAIKLPKPTASLREKIKFLRGNSLLVFSWPVAALILAILAWAILFERLDAEKKEVENDALTDASTIARSHAVYVKRTMDSIDQTLLLLQMQWESSNGKMRLETFKERGLFPDAEPFTASIVDRNGFRRTSTFGERARKSDPNVSDRSYFLAQIAATSDFLYVGLPTIGRTTGNPVIQYSRRLQDKNNNFEGVVLVAVKTDFFTANYDSLNLGVRGFLGVVGIDGLLRAARTGDTVYGPKSNPLPAAAQFRHASGSTFGGSTLLDGGTSFGDKRNRYVGWQFVEGYPVIAIAGLDQEEVLAPYWKSRQASIRNAAGTTLALLLFTFIAMALSVRLAWRKYQLDLVKATYRKATEGGSEGFYIARPIRNEAGEIMDFQAIDCNERGAAFFRLRRKEFIGQMTSSLYDQGVVQALRGMLTKAMETGRYEGELALPVDPRGHERFVQFKAVRSDGDLAVTLRDITHEKQHLRNLEQRSNEDLLTGLPNRSWVNTFLPDAVARAVSCNGMLAVLFIDLDGFKEVNDRLGHAAGDDILRNAGRRLKEAVRPHDNVARLGGDEFIVILEEIRQESDAAHVAERVLHAFKEIFRVRQGVASIGTSIGISIFPNDAKDAGALLQNADIAMYAVKTRGKHYYQFFNPAFYDALQSRMKRESDLRYAIENDQFIMYYQARLDMATGRTSSMEALVRWMHPSEGLIEPREFIPLAEETGLILELGELVIDKVCAQIGQWMRDGGPMVPVSINVSSRQFNEADIPKMLFDALAKHAIDASLVEVELTESAVMGNIEDVSDAINVIHGLGIKLLVDDFGTGYSSLSKLQRLDFDILKVDKSFTEQLGKGKHEQVFFSAIITMAHALGMRVVAEGVEKKEQLDILRELLCDEIQGFYISHPLAPTQAQSGLCQGLPKNMVAVQ